MLPKDGGNRLVIKEDRVKYWVSVGALPSDRVARFLGDAGLMDKPATPANQTKQDKPKAKAQERLQEQADKAEAAVAAAAEAAAAPAEEAPAQEPAAEEASS